MEVFLFCVHRFPSLFMHRFYSSQLTHDPPVVAVDDGGEGPSFPNSNFL